MVLRVSSRALLQLSGVIGLLIIMLSLPVSATETPAQLLAQADTLRVSDPARSRQILQALNNQSLTPAEQDYRDYLLGFHAAIASDSDGAVSIIEPISRRHPADELGLRARATLLSIYYGYREWSEGLLLSAELKELLGQLPRKDSWYTANFSVVIYYINLQMYNEALNLLEWVTGPELAQVSAAAISLGSSGRKRDLILMLSHLVGWQHWRLLVCLCLTRFTPLSPSSSGRDIYSTPGSMRPF